MTDRRPSNEPPDWDAIARHRSGESEGDDARRMAEWLAAHPRDAEMLAILDAQIAAGLSTPATDAPDVEGALRRVHEQMQGASSARVLPFPRERTLTSRRWFVASVAAAAAAAAAVAVGLGSSRDAADRGAGPAVRGAAGSVVATGIGMRDSVRLGDGTRVILAPASRLTVSPAYGHGSRDVTLEGMAWLSVKHDDAAPFTLHAGGATVRDVGTEFTARTDADGGIVSVAVTEGSVELRAGPATAAPVTLVAGDRGQVSAAGRIVAERGGASVDDVSWSGGRLAFRAASMDRVQTELRRWYGVDLQLADSALRSRRITATFDGDPVDRVLQVIALALGAQMERRDSVAVLRSGATK